MGGDPRREPEAQTIWRGPGGRSSKGSEAEPGAETLASAGLRPVRPLDDPRSLRALAHPVRLALIDLLIIHGSLTASGAGRLLGLEPNAVSFHLRQLARYGFVAEVSGGKGRRRPWKLVRSGFSWSDGAGEAAVIRASEALSEVNFARRQRQLQEWMSRRVQEQPAWRRAASASFSTVFLTQEELADLGRRLGRLALEYADRTEPSRRPAGSRAIVVQTYSFPLLDERLAGDEPDDADAPGRPLPEGESGSSMGKSPA